MVGILLESRTGQLLGARQIAPLVHEQLGQQVVAADELGVGVDGRLVELLLAAGLASQAVQPTQVEQRLVVLRGALDGLFVQPHRLPNAAVLLAQDRQVEAGRHQLLVDGDSAAKELLGFA